MDESLATAGDTQASRSCATVMGVRGFRAVLALLVLATPGAAMAARPKARPARVTCRPPYVRTVEPAVHHHGRSRVVCLAPYPLPPAGF
jgi:hypothetical protein